MSASLGKLVEMAKLASHCAAAARPRALRADPVVEHLAQQHPDDRPPGDAEEHDEQVRGEQRDDAGAVAEAPARRCAPAPYRTPRPSCPGSTAMPADPISSRMRRPILSMTAIATSVTTMFVTERDDRDGQRVVLAEADLLPQRRGVVEDHVDADELLEDRQRRYRSRRSAAARCPCCFRSLKDERDSSDHGAPDLGHPLVDAGLEDLAEHPACLVGLPLDTR